MEDVFDAIKNHCSGVAWGATVPMTGPGSLGEDLLGILDGKTILDQNGNPWGPITTEADLNLNSGTDELDYFDPGLFPGEFGENPEDIFDMQN